MPITPDGVLLDRVTDRHAAREERLHDAEAGELKRPAGSAAWIKTCVAFCQDVVACLFFGNLAM
jgi:hypothetical protein